MPLFPSYNPKTKLNQPPLALRQQQYREINKSHGKKGQKNEHKNRMCRLSLNDRM